MESSCPLLFIAYIPQSLNPLIWRKYCHVRFELNLCRAPSKLPHPTACMMLRGLLLSLRLRTSVVHQCRNISHSFTYGEQVLAIDQKGRKYLFELKENGELHLNSGRLLHSTISTGCPGQRFKTHLGTADLVVRRPSLEEYTLLMARGPTPTYPKDILAMIGLMDVNPGARVVEAGSGSGAMTLHLSKAGWWETFLILIYSLHGI